jgi:hypothetical protein
LEVLETVVEKTHWYALVPNAVPNQGTLRGYFVDVTPVRFPTPLQVHDRSYTMMIMQVINVDGVIWV